MSIYDFTYSSYSQLISNIVKNGYTFTNYHQHENVVNPCIICHDVDFDVEKALNLAKFEIDKHSLQTTYFILINTDFYNVFSNTVNQMIKEMIKMGHEIGLHFDETCYPSHCLSIVEHIKKEITLLEQIIEHPVKAVSMHRPSKTTLEANLVIPCAVNRYSKLFFNDFKYLSDSRHNWKEDVESIVFSKQYSKLHISTHPIWFTEQKESCKDKLISFVNSANMKRYESMNNNFSNLDKILYLDDVR